MLVNTRAIVISALKYGEADLIVKCFTEEAGLKTYLLRSILKSKKGKLRTAMLTVTWGFKRALRCAELVITLILPGHRCDPKMASQIDQKR